MILRDHNGLCGTSSPHLVSASGEHSTDVNDSRGLEAAIPSKCTWRPIITSHHRHSFARDLLPGEHLRHGLVCLLEQQRLFPIIRPSRLRIRMQACCRRIKCFPGIQHATGIINAKYDPVPAVSSDVSERFSHLHERSSARSEPTSWSQQKVASSHEPHASAVIAILTGNIVFLACHLLSAHCRRP